MNIYPGYRPTARTSEEVQETPKNMQPTADGVPVWSKAMLITFWVIQIIICIIGWGIGALALGTKRLLDDGDYSYSHGVKLALRYGNTCLPPLKSSSNIHIYQCGWWRLGSMGQCNLHPHRRRDHHVFAPKLEGLVRGHFLLCQDHIMVGHVFDLCS